MGNTLKAIDLFCGCGGISTGLQKSGFKIIAGIDVEEKYLASYKHNFPSSIALNADITKVPPSEFMKLVNVAVGELDLLVGGPPCQGFSKNVPRKNRFLEDPKNLLVKSFLDYCEALQPKMVLMENVAEMKNGFEEAYSQEIISRLENAGYVITSTVLNAADFGVPQRRKRAFFLANRYGIKFTPPSPTHLPPDKKKILGMRMLFDQPAHVSVWDAIGDLPSVVHDDPVGSSKYATKPTTQFQALMRDGAKRLHNHIARKLQPKQHERLSSLEPGQGHRDLPEHLQTKGGYSGAYGRLTKDMVAPTITRWVFHPGSGRWGHPVDIRTLTIREAARIQSFPDAFEFVGSYNDQAGQIGNAVPPLLAQRIVECMLAQVPLLRNSTKSSHETFDEGSKKAIA